MFGDLFKKPEQLSAVPTENFNKVQDFGYNLMSFKDPLIKAKYNQSNREDVQMKALQNLSQRMQSGGIERGDALKEYSGITGDFSPMFGGSDGGATGVLVQRLMAENPGMSFGDALAQVQTGYRKGMRFVNGKAVPIEGYGESQKDIGFQREYGERSGDLTARGQKEPQVEADVTTAKSEAQFMEEGRQMLPKLRQQLETKELRESFLDDKISDIAQRANPWSTGFKGSIASAVPGSKAYDLKSDVQTLLANAGFDRLQEMRMNSPTGGSLGQITEREIELLQSSAQNILQSQSQEQFERNLKEFQEQRRKSLKRIRNAYRKDTKRFGDKYLVEDESDFKTAQPEEGAVDVDAPVDKPLVWNPEIGDFE